MTGIKAYRRSILIAALVGIIPRVWLWMTYPFAQGNDTPTYIHLANNLSNNLGFAKYNGTRVPGYPFFILVTGDPKGLYLLQLILGLATSLILFWLITQLTKSPFLGLVGSVAHSLNLGQLFYEASMLTESLSAFFFILSAAFLFHAIQKDEEKNSVNLWFSIIASGISALVLASIRPLFLTFPFVAALFLLRFKNKTVFLRSLWKGIVIGLPTFAALLLWVGFIYVRFNVIGLDAIGGYHMVNHTSSFFELASDDHALIRDIFIHYRDIKVVESGSPINTIWDAIPELMETTKLNYYALGKEMGAISNELIRQNPGQYFVNVIKGWLWFWKVGVYWDPSAISDPLLRRGFELLMLAERMLLIGLNGAFLLGAGLHFLPSVRRILRPERFTVLIISFIGLTSILQTFAEHGDNPRFLAPAQSLVVGLVILWIARISEWRKHAR